MVKKNSRNYPKKIQKRRCNKQRKGKKRRPIAKDLAISLGLTLMICGLIAQLLFSFPKVQGYGMNPQLTNRDWLVVYKYGRLRRFSMVYLAVPNRKNEYMIRRIIGLPGEEISYKNDQLTVNGEEIEERFLYDQVRQAKQEEHLFTEDFTSRQLSTEKTARIPAGKYLVLGDNRPYASDSRYYGYVDEKDIVGIVKMRLLPLHEVTGF